MKPQPARVLEPIVFYGIVSTVALSTIPYGTVEPWWISLFESLVFLLAMLAIAHSFITRSWRLDSFSLAVPLIVLTLFIVLQTFPLFPRNGSTSPGASLSVDPYGSELFAIKLFALILIGVLASRYTT